MAIVSWLDIGLWFGDWDREAESWGEMGIVPSVDGSILRRWRYYSEPDEKCKATTHTPYLDLNSSISLLDSSQTAPNASIRLTVETYQATKL